MSMEYPCIYFEKDGKCRKFSDNTAISYCVMGPCPEQKLSNADRIRAMSDEELAEIFCVADWCNACGQLKQDGTCHAMEMGGPLHPYCKAGCLTWLRQSAVEEAR